MPNHLVSIGLILYKNPEDEIYHCLTGLKSQSARSAIKEVLIRDQGGGDGQKFVDRWIAENPGALNITFSVGRNVGFGAGHNALFSEMAEDSTGYLCLNPDGVMHPDCLAEMLAVAEREKWLGIFEPLQEPIMHPKVYSPQTGETAWSSGACLLIPAAIYREIGGYDDDYFLYCEDVDLSWRVKAAGYRCFVSSGAFFFHYAMDRAGRVNEIWRSACILAHKWRSANFKTHALNVLATLVDIHRDELQADIEKFAQHPIEDVYRASPNFKNNLTFSEPMWT